MKTSIDSETRRTLMRLRSGAPAAVAVAGLIALGLIVLAPKPASAQPDIPAGAHFSSWADNGKDGERILQVVKGDLSKVAVSVDGLVKTDTNCDPDAAGVNHCHNVIGLANGGEIEVVHNHAMMRYPCLSPGEKLTLARLADGWLVAKDAQ
jgi:hypothetical protein